MSQVDLSTYQLTILTLSHFFLAGFVFFNCSLFVPLINSFKVEFALQLIVIIRCLKAKKYLNLFNYFSCVPLEDKIYGDNKGTDNEVCLCFDIPMDWQVNFQDPATPLMEGLMDLHHDIMFIIVTIITLVFYLLLRVILALDHMKPKHGTKITHFIELEAGWIFVPTLILGWIAIPSFALLYSMDGSGDPQLLVKVIGNQWYWTYEYDKYSTMREGLSFASKGLNAPFDSYMILEENLKKGGGFRLLSVDLQLNLPVHWQIRVLVTSADVLHSWAIPSLGIKLDACPGRLNEVLLQISRRGTYYGQCSEICGINHGFMPIVVKADIFNQNILHYFALFF